MVWHKLDHGVWPDECIYVGGSETMSTLIPEKEKAENEDIKENNNDKENKNKETPLKEVKSIRRVKTKKDKNDPFRFQGDGVGFKAKLIGIQEVKDARGDEMCQEALQSLKTYIRTSGEHKLKISISVSLDGLRIIDDKTGDIQHHHPVHKISFIARDVTDSRAFGYIYGTPSGGHKFFGIKTEKAAENLVMTMRDLFQVVYEVKKTEMETAKQLQAEQLKEDLYKVPPEGVARPISFTKEGDYDVPTNIPVDQNQAPISYVSLTNLQNELHTIQQGIDQMDDQLSDEAFFSLILDSSDKKLTPDSTGSDPFLPLVGQANPFTASNSFTAVDVSVTKDLFHDDPFGPLPTVSPPSGNSDPFVVFSSTPTPTLVAAMDKYAVFTEFSETSLFSSSSSDTSTISSSTFTGSSSLFNDAFSSSQATTEMLQPPVPPARSSSPQLKDPFADLCDLGKDHPPQDKKEFFAELKNPPKKITLNDLKKGVYPNERSSSPEAIYEDSQLDFSLPSPQAPPPPLPTSIEVEEIAPPPPPRPSQSLSTANPVPKPRRNIVPTRQSPPAEHSGVSNNNLNFPILPPPPHPNNKLENLRTKDLNIFSKKEDPFADDDFFTSVGSKNNLGSWR